ncbi:MAG: GGDEF domain-containing protein [Clostridia bacterium]|nr:GGDEF domain-containing protein [Clostridia bacterium]
MKFCLQDLSQDLGGNPLEFEGVFDVVRIVDPVKKVVLQHKKNNFCEIILEHQQAEENHQQIYESDITTKAYKMNDMFFKIKKVKERAYMIMAIPIRLEGRVMVIELTKNISENMISDLENYTFGLNELMSITNAVAIKDSLTEVYNRRYINKKLPREIAFSTTANNSVSIILTDIDHFKNINDSHGHIVGDKVLVQFVEIIESCLKRKNDWVARFGGEEFLICLPNTENKEAQMIAEKIRKKVEEAQFDYEGNTFKVTASFGIHSITQYIDFMSAIDMADKKLYKAKESGRNKVEV